MILHEISVTYVPKYVIGFCRVGAEVWSLCGIVENAGGPDSTIRWQGELDLSIDVWRRLARFELENWAHIATLDPRQVV